MSNTRAVAIRRQIYITPAVTRDPNGMLTRSWIMPIGGRTCRCLPACLGDALELDARKQCTAPRDAHSASLTYIELRKYTVLTLG